MKPIIIFFIFILMISFSYAYDCSVFSGLDQENCLLLNTVDENLIANLIYKNTSYPDYEFIRQYNDQIVVNNPPNDVILYDFGVLNDAWVSILSIDPSITYNNTLFIPKIVNARGEYNYSIVLPQDYYSDNPVNGQTCQVIYSKNSEESNLEWFIDDKTVGSGKNVQIISNNYTLLKAQARIEVVVKSEAYVWRKYCCKRENGHCLKYCYNCKYSSTTYTPNILVIQDNVTVKNYEHVNFAEFTIINQYLNTSKGVLEKDNLTSVILSFNNSFYKYQRFVFLANFSKKSYYFLTLTAIETESETTRNLIRNDNIFYVNDARDCSLEYSDFFTTQTKPCNINITAEEVNEFIPSKFSTNLNLLLKILVFIFVIYLIYKGVKHYWGKALIPITALLFLIPSVRAEDCGITNLASCIPQKIYEFVLNLLNAPLEPLLDLVKNLLQSSPSISLFQGVWAIIIYCISLFYGLLFVYSGFQFLTAGHDVIKREMAKEWLKNTVIMIVLVQASFYLYGLIVDIGSVMTSSILSLVDTHFFMITADNLTNIGLELVFIGLYVITLVITLLFLTLRYLIVAFGVLFAPLGIFCYYIPPLRTYGKLILNILGMLIFITFLDAIIILACSMLINIELFQNVKILVMITCFTIINLLFIVLAHHIITKTSLSDGASKIAKAAKYIAMMI